jgi:hypothetical protein
VQTESGNSIGVRLVAQLRQPYSRPLARVHRRAPSANNSSVAATVRPRPWRNDAVMRDPSELVDVQLTHDERHMLHRGLAEWGGPASCTNAMAIAMARMS